MKFLSSIIFLLLFACGLAHAQQQEKKLEERIMKPDMTQGAREQTRGFNDAKSFSTSNAPGEKRFSWIPSFPLKSFFTKSYAPKSYWAGEYQAQARNNNLSNIGTPHGADKAVPTQTVPVTDARENGKGYPGKNPYQTKELRDEGKSQKALDQQQAQKGMSIDEIRDLLNKNK